jgi:DNA-binding PadR family transcriptional regulator
MAEPFTIYKMTILYMLDRADFALTNTQIYNFFLEMEYTDYFSVQGAIASLVDAGLIDADTSHSTTQYTLTAAGRESLGFFRGKLNEGIEEDVRTYFEKNKLTFRQDNSIISDYRRLRNQKYEVDCSVKNYGDTILALTMQVGSREQAESICAHWKKQSSDVYAYLMDTLLS